MKILIAEDDLTARTLLSATLKKWGYEVTAVNDGQAAWAVLQQPDCPRLIILDWVMPVMDGLEVIRNARALYREQPLYIILLTSKDEKGDILSGLETGANDYIKKPFNTEELYARIRVGHRTVELQNSLYETQLTLEHLATHDPLTGILNRRAIVEQLSKELARSHRSRSCNKGYVLFIVYFDIDHFKQINDRYGHQAGDEVLCGIAATLKSHLRVYDSFGRMGGDEFMIIAPENSDDNCKPLLERLLAAIGAWKITRGPDEISVTVSMGAVLVNSESCLDQLLDSVDGAMYRAKREGGNRIVYSV